MKLNPVCIRDLLTAVEESCTCTAIFEYEKNNKPPILQNHFHESIIYHACQCNDDGLFKHFEINDSGTSFFVSDLTPKGHALLHSIRDNTIWKQIATKGISSIPSLVSLVVETLTAGK